VNESQHLCQLAKAALSAQHRGNPAGAEVLFVLILQDFGSSAVQLLLLLLLPSGDLSPSEWTRAYSRTVGDDDRQRGAGHFHHAALYRRHVSQAAVGAEAAAVFGEEVKAQAVGRKPAGAASAAAAPQQLLLAQDVAPDDLAKGLSELPDAVGVDEGVDHGVGVGQDNGHVHDPGGRPLTLRTVEGEAVDDVERQPADGKQPDDDGQRLGDLDLLLQRGAGILAMDRFHLHQFELAASSHEDAQVDGQHQQQGDEHTGKEVEVDHILHDHHLLKQAPHQAGRAGDVGARGPLVPAHHGGQADDDG